MYLIPNLSIIEQYLFYQYLSMIDFCNESGSGEHKRFIRVCIDCALDNQRNQSYKQLIFCAKCNKTLHTKHKEHIKCFKLNDQQFKNYFSNFRSFLKDNYPTSQHIFVKPIISKSIDSFDYDIFANAQFRKWICSVQFWDTDSPQSRSRLKSKIQKGGVGKESSMHEEESVIKIDWGMIDEEIELLGNLVLTGKKDKEDIEGKIEILDLLIKIYSSYEESQKKGLKQDLQKLKASHPEDINLLLAELFLIEIHSENFHNCEPILDKICKLDQQFTKSPAYPYFNSLKYVKMLDPQKLKQNSLLLVDSRSSKFFTFTDAEKFIENINKAILNLQPKQNKIFYQLKGLAYLSEQKMQQAEKQFQKALRKSSSTLQQTANQSLLNNISYLAYKNDPNHGVQFLENYISARNSQQLIFRINSIKYFKIIRNFDLIVQYTEKNVEDVQKSSFLRLQRAKALLKVGRIGEAVTDMDLMKNEVTERQKKKFDRQKLYAMGRDDIKKEQYSSASQIFNELSKEKTSVAANFNLAYSYFLDQKWQQAEKTLQLALAQKPTRKKYLKLKFQILIMKKQMERAKQMLKLFESEEIEKEIIEALEKY